MGFIDAQPIEFKDFSGGLTDNVLQGDPKRYARADNFVITVDRKLENRYGTVLYDPTANTLPGNSGRVGNLFTAINEGVLFAHANRDIYVQSPDARYGTAFARVLGPTGNEAISGGSSYNQITTAEFQRQILFTSDYGVQPGRLFRDHTGAWKSVTAGLPKMAWTPNFPNDSALVARCITLANLLRASMISHFNDSAEISSGTSSIYQHKRKDKWATSYLQAVSAWGVGDAEYPGPATTITPAPAASDSASLYVLTTALALAYEHHRNDLAGPLPTTGSGSRILHQDIYLQPPTAALGLGTQPAALGINAKLTLSGAVTTPQKAAAFLDELAQKWYWHQLSPFSHAPDNDLNLMSKYLLAANNSSIKIGTVYQSSTTIQVTPNYNDFIALAYWARLTWNNHTTSSDAFMHGQFDTYGPITLSTPVDFDSAALTLFWARWIYGNVHVFDSNVATHTRVTFSTTAGSASITSVATTSTGVALTLPLDSWIVMQASRFNDTNTLNRRVARVIASGAGTATLSKTCLNTVVGDQGQYSTSWLHGAWVNGALSTAASDTTATVAGSSEFLATGPGVVGTDLKSWIAYASEWFLALGAHKQNAKSHATSSFMGNELQGNAPSNQNPFFIPTVATYGWSAFYRYTSTVEQNGQIYLDQGPPIFSTSIQTTPSYPVNTVLASPNSTYFNSATIVTENPNATISGIPGLVNTTLTNYDTVVSVTPIPTIPGSAGYNQNLTVELYRTTDGGTTFYYLDSVTNVATSYSDSTNEAYPRLGDDALNTRKVIYTSGGVVAWDQPPQCKYVHQVNNIIYYGAVTDTGQFFPQRIRASVQSQPGAAPATFFDDLEDELTGLSSHRSNLIAMCRNSVYRCAGNFTSTGQGSMSHERISNAMGCLNAKSIVQTEIGVFYAGTDGFYYTDGYQVIKISLDLDASYQALTKTAAQRARIYGCYDKNTRRVWWAMQSAENGQDNDVFFIFYLNYGVKPSGVFTKALTTSSWMPASAVFFKGNLVIGDSRGYLFKTDPNAKDDPKVDTSTSPANWITVYMPWAFRTCGLDMGTTGKRKWVTKIHTIGQNVGNAAIQVNSINDAGSLPDGSSSSLPLAPIQYTKNLMWGDPTVVWGDSSVAWKYDGTMDVWRRFPSRSLRSDFKAVEYVPGNFVIYKYDNYPAFSFASVSSVGKTATLATPAGYASFIWPLEVVDYYISFDTDAYATKYLITALDVTKKIITFSDAGNTVTTNGAAKWQISGVRKNQRVRITAFNIHAATLGQEFQAYPGASAPGGMGANS
jgi:hypothetical protein